MNGHQCFQLQCKGLETEASKPIPLDTKTSGQEGIVSAGVTEQPNCWAISCEPPANWKQACKNDFKSWSRAISMCDRYDGSVQLQQLRAITIKILPLTPSVLQCMERKKQNQH